MTKELLEACIFVEGYTGILTARQTMPGFKKSPLIQNSFNDIFFMNKIETIRRNVECIGNQRTSNKLFTS